MKEMKPDGERGHDRGVHVGGERDHGPYRSRSSWRRLVAAVLSAAGLASEPGTRRVAAPLQRRGRHRPASQRQRQRRHQRGRQVEAAVVRRGQHLAAVLGDQPVLDLALGQAVVHQVLDEGTLAVGLRRLGGQGQRRAAHRAHDLVLHGAEGGARLAVGGRRRGRSRQGQQHDQNAERAPHDLPSTKGATSRRMNASSTGPRLTAATRPRGSITIVSGTPATP